MDPVQAISQYFGCEPKQEGIVEPENSKAFFFEVGTLKYQIYLDLVGRMFSISGDPEFPFTGNSLYEVYVPFDRIAIETEPMFYGSQSILVCRKDFTTEPNFKTLMIVKWSDTRISVWQNYPSFTYAT
jgi:hypothetical protein